MNHYSLLLKKQVLDILPARTRKKRLSDWAGILLMALLAAVIIAVFVVVFSKFVETYCGIKINRVSDIAARQFEIMSMAYFALILVFIFSGVSALNHTLFENSDLNILITMPFSSTDIFLSKLTTVYLKQLVFAIACVFSVNFTFFVTTGTLNVYNGLMTVVVAVLLPVIPLAVAAIITLPYHYLKTLVSSNYVLLFAVMTIIMALFCWGYSFVFDVAQNLLASGKITKLFDENVMKGIISFTKYNYPANLFAYLMLGREIGKNIGILAGILVGAGAICFFLVRALFIGVTHSDFSVRIPHSRKKNLHFSNSTRFGALMRKEFLLVMRTPGYAYMYFTTAAIMPIMAYCSAKITIGVFSNLVGNVDVGFELCTFIAILYSTLTNTFCSTNISRDGYMSLTQKTLPYSPAKILGSKMAFCSIVAIASTLITCIVMAATRLESVQEAVVTLFATSMIAFAQIVFATKLDLAHPHFAKTDDGEIKEANSTVSAVIAVGLLTSCIIGFGLMFNSISSLITGDAVVETGNAVSYSIALCCPFALLLAAIGYFAIGLKKAYANLDTEN